jgi:DNA-binding NarL/FixJ family response regulator
MSDVDSAQKKARILLVEDHPIMRHGLAMLIDDQPDLTTCGGAETTSQGIALVHQFKPDLVVVDISLKEGDGIELMKAIHDAYPDMAILAMSMHEETVFAERALRVGARGYIMKREAMEKVLTAIRRVLSGDIYISEKMTAHMVKKVTSRPTSPMDSLSDREFEIFRLLAGGIGPTEIGQKLNLSVKTIETHRGHIKEKLGLKTAAELSRCLSEWGMKNL